MILFDKKKQETSAGKARASRPRLESAISGVLTT
jgi:hypothetical protein